MLVAAPAFAAKEQRSSQAGDLVAGTGSISGFGNPQVHVNAKQTKKDDKGSFHIKYPEDGDFRGNVTCLFVEDNTAYVVGQIEKSTNDDFEEGQYVVIGVQDGGEPGANADKVNFSPASEQEPECGINPQATPNLPIVKGNFVVKDR